VHPLAREVGCYAIDKLDKKWVSSHSAKANKGICIRASFYNFCSIIFILSVRNQGALVGVEDGWHLTRKILLIHRSDAFLRLPWYLRTTFGNKKPPQEKCISTVFLKTVLEAWPCYLCFLSHPFPPPREEWILERGAQIGILFVRETRWLNLMTGTRIYVIMLYLLDATRTGQFVRLMSDLQVSGFSQMIEFGGYFEYIYSRKNTVNKFLIDSFQLHFMIALFREIWNLERSFCYCKGWM